MGRLTACPSEVDYYHFVDVAKLIKISQKQIKRRKFLSPTKKFRDLLYFLTYLVFASFCSIFNDVLYLILYPNYQYIKHITTFRLHRVLYLNLQAVLVNI